MDTTYDDGLVKPQAAWGAMFSMALRVVALIASEFMPVNLVTPIANGLGITKGRATIVAILRFGWGFFGTVAQVGSGTRLSRALRDDTESCGGLQVVIIQFAITLGVALGGLLFDALGWRSPSVLGRILLLGSALAAAAAVIDHGKAAQ
ncbi:MAG TPA: hypothetical protein VNQ56_15430 [Pseudolabrys sp.]|nr:hypothetical protein [Pseudolabrys sp.]